MFDPVSNMFILAASFSVDVGAVAATVTLEVVSLSKSLLTTAVTPAVHQSQKVSLREHKKVSWFWFSDFKATWKWMESSRHLKWLENRIQILKIVQHSFEHAAQTAKFDWFVGKCESITEFKTTPWPQWERRNTFSFLKYLLLHPPGFRSEWDNPASFIVYFYSTTVRHNTKYVL